MTQDKITLEKIEKYQALTEKALSIAKKNISKNRKGEAQEIIKMVECYLQDSIYFQQKGDFVNSFAAINYAHGWLDSGSRLGIFHIKNSEENHKILSF